MIRIKVAEVENFLSFKNKQRFEFHNHGIHYIHGINLDSKDNADEIEGLDANTEELSDDMFSVGSGKSSFTYICQYVFYGKIVKKVKMDDVINKDVKKDLYTMIEFDINNEEYRIERYRRHYEFKNNLFLFKKSGNDWIDLSDSDTEMTQEKIQKLIVLNAITFQKSILFHRDDMKQFLDLNEIGRSEIFENIIQLNRFKDYFEKRKQEYKKVVNRINEINVEISNCKTKVNMSLDYIKQQKDLVQKKKQQIRDEIEELEDNIQLLTSTTGNINIIIGKLNQYKRLSKQISDANSKLIKSKRERDNVKNEVSLMESQIRQLQSTIQNSEEFLEHLKDNKCTKCGHVEENIQTKINEIEKQITDSEVLLEGKYELLKGFKDQLSEKVDIVKGIEDELSEIKIKIDSLELQDELLTSLLENEDIIEQIKQLNTSIEERKGLLESYNLESPLITKTKGDILEYKKQYEQLNAEKKLKRKEEQINHWWMDKLDIRNGNSIKQYIINKIIPVFNNILQRIVNYVYFGELEIVFDNFFNETIIKNSQLYSYEELSTGEKGKLNLCINLAIFELTRINMHGCSVMFVDEVLVNVDTSTVQLFIDLFREKYSNDCAIYFISHQEEVMQKLRPESITKIIKKNGCSNIIIEDSIDE